jgi:hypothetical protein
MKIGYKIIGPTEWSAWNVSLRLADAPRTFAQFSNGLATSPQHHPQRFRAGGGGAARAG